MKLLLRGEVCPSLPDGKVPVPTLPVKTFPGTGLECLSPAKTWHLMGSIWSALYVIITAGRSASAIQGLLQALMAGCVVLGTGLFQPLERHCHPVL